MRESIFAHSLSIGRLGNTRQLLGINRKGDTVILAQLPTMTNERALLVDKHALARSLQFNLIDDELKAPSPSPVKRSARTAREDWKSALALVELLAIAIVALVMQFFRK